MTITVTYRKKAKVSNADIFLKSIADNFSVFLIAEYRDIIQTRVIGFTFLNDIIRFPQDPYGKEGPSLNDILNGKRIE